MRNAWRRVQRSMWFIPVLCALAGVGLSIVTISIDRATDFELVPKWLTGDSDAALQILSTVAASIVSLIALVLTVTMVVVQLAMGQFSPRIVRTFLRDRPSQLVIGFFAATFVHAMIAMREVNGDHVPGLAVLIAYVLVVISIMMLVLYVHHIGQSLRVSALIELVGNDTRERIDEEYEPGAPCRNEHGAVVMPSSAVVSAIDEDRLVEVARRHDARVEMHWGIGSFVPAGATLAVVDGGTPPRDHEVLRCIGRTLERDLDHDAAYGIRMLVDMAERSVSESSFLDPTTAVQAIDRIHDCLRQLVTRQFRSEHVRDEDGVVRVIVPRMSWNDYVRLAFEEIRLAGAGSPQVSRRVEAALTDLCAVAPPERRAVLDEQLDLLHSAVEDRHRDVRDTQMAAGGDTEGIGRATSTPSRA